MIEFIICIKAFANPKTEKSLKFQEIRIMQKLHISYALFSSFFRFLRKRANKNLLFVVYVLVFYCKDIAITDSSIC